MSTNQIVEAGLAWLSHWLPLMQGFAALASVVGATLSWRYALKAQRAQEQMTENVVTANVLESLDTMIRELDTFRDTSVNQDGRPNFDAYKRASSRNKAVLEARLAQCRAVQNYIQKKPTNWVEMLNRLSESAREPDSSAIDEVIRVVRLVAEELRVSAIARRMAPEK